MVQKKFRCDNDMSMFLHDMSVKLEKTESEVIRIIIFNSMVNTYKGKYHMKTSKPISTISYNSEEFLKAKLDYLVRSGEIAFWVLY